MLHSMCSSKITRASLNYHQDWIIKGSVQFPKEECIEKFWSGKYRKKSHITIFNINHTFWLKSNVKSKITILTKTYIFHKKEYFPQNYNFLPKLQFSSKITCLTKIKGCDQNSHFPLQNYIFRWQKSQSWL